MDSRKYPPDYNGSESSQNRGYAHDHFGPQPFPQQHQNYGGPQYQPQQQPSTTVITLGGQQSGAMIPGSCPVCHNLQWSTTFPCCAWVVLIIFFPIGILCCLCMRKKKCTKCGFSTG